MSTKGIAVLIPAFNEENSIGKVLADIPMDWVDEVVVVNNNSNDKTAEVARNLGATVLDETKQGYGAACLKGIRYYQQKAITPEILVFLDADYSDYPEQLPLLVKPILEKQIDMVIGSRALGQQEPGSMTIPQRFGNWLACSLLKLFYGVKLSLIHI